MNFVVMSFKTFFLLLALWAVAINAIKQPSFLSDPRSRAAVVKSNIAFSKTFTNLVIEEHKNENVVCSPLSAHIILALAAYGAQGNTGMQLYNTICLPNSFCLASSGYKQLMYEFKDVENVTIKLANKIYTANGLELNEHYQMIAEDSFLSEVVTMKGTPAEFVDDVNKWVDEKTNHKINQLISKDDISEDTSLVLLNAIYFDGNWEKPFDSKSTFDGTFYNFDNTTSTVSMMINSKASFLHGDVPKLNASFVELPYKNSEYKMIIIVPNTRKADKDAFEELGQKLKTFDYQELQNFSNSYDFMLIMPKFTIESSLDLEPVLKKMGVTDMFTRAANFKSITKYPENRLQVDKVVQKAFIRVNESGSEAAAASGVSLVLRSSAGIISANKPFYFAIVSPQGTLFEGRVILPVYVEA